MPPPLVVAVLAVRLQLYTEPLLARMATPPPYAAWFRTNVLHAMTQTTTDPTGGALRWLTD